MKTMSERLKTIEKIAEDRDKALLSLIKIVSDAMRGENMGFASGGWVGPSHLDNKGPAGVIHHGGFIKLDESSERPISEQIMGGPITVTVINGENQD